MRRLSVVMFAMLAACELQPAPKQQAAPPAPTPPRVVEAPADAGVVADAPPAPVFTDQCREVGLHIAEVIINSATDPGAKSIYEQDRSKISRSTAETCMTQGWSDVAAKCYLKARTATELKACETKYTPPQPRARPEEPQTREGSGAGSGSAAAPGAGAGSAAAPRAGAGSAAAPRPGAGSAAAPRPGAGAAAPRAGSGSAAAPRPGAGTAPRPGAGSAAAPRAGSGSAAR